MTAKTRNPSKTSNEAAEKAAFIEDHISECIRKGRAPNADRLKPADKFKAAKLTRAQASVLKRIYDAERAGMAADYELWKRAKASPEPDTGSSDDVGIDDAGPSVLENYESYDAAKFEAEIAFFDKIVKALGPFAAAAPKKQKPAADQAAKFKQAKKDPAHAFLKQHDAAGIIGAKRAWVWNIKSRRLGRYVASDAGRGLGFKDGRISGFDREASVSKACMKPDESIKGKRVWDAVFEALPGMALPLDGKGSAQVMIVKIIK